MMMMMINKKFPSYLIFATCQEWCQVLSYMLLHLIFKTNSKKQGNWRNWDAQMSVNLHWITFLVYDTDFPKVCVLSTIQALFQLLLSNPSPIPLLKNWNRILCGRGTQIYKLGKCRESMATKLTQCGCPHTDPSLTEALELFCRGQGFEDMVAMALDTILTSPLSREESIHRLPLPPSCHCRGIPAGAVGLGFFLTGDYQ